MKRKHISWAIALTVLTVAATGTWVHANRQSLLQERFADWETTALALPFRGVQTSDGIEPGLYPLRDTGLDTSEISTAASAFVQSLDDQQRQATLFTVDDQEWRRWSNVDNGIYKRQGTSLRQMTSQQAEAAWELLSSSLSPAGLELSRNIMKTDHTLAEFKQDFENYGEDLYFLTLMGEPDPAEPWGWQLDGHHLIINTFLLGGQMVMSPVFLGGEPVHTRSGKYAGNVILQQQQNLGLALLRSLSPQHRSEAVLDELKTGNNLQAGFTQDNIVLDYQGVRVADFSARQKSQLLHLIEQFVGTMRDDQAEQRMRQIEQHLDDTWFAWIGAQSDDAVFYYRIHSPVVLIEFDHQNPVGSRHINAPGQPTLDHIHVMIRTPNGNDYGKDLLRQHLQSHSH